MEPWDRFGIADATYIGPISGFPSDHSSPFARWRTNTPECEAGEEFRPIIRSPGCESSAIERVPNPLGIASPRDFLFVWNHDSPNRVNGARKPTRLLFRSSWGVKERAGGVRPSDDQEKTGGNGWGTNALTLRLKSGSSGSRARSEEPREAIPKPSSTVGGSGFNLKAARRRTHRQRTGGGRWAAQEQAMRKTIVADSGSTWTTEGVSWAGRQKILGGSWRNPNSLTGTRAERIKSIEHQEETWEETFLGTIGFPSQTIYHRVSEPHTTGDLFATGQPMPLI
ncbi:hypothetical protein FA13DRAFT_1717327 [Coprinellus micaceus]|uniref:Uncharacterized protein n=1 Tax=Coprinellus micaceus TaxID=71717 RepID=A0A4Y7SGK6_COPMI|nr:hypothetical protein FA13DRAFT_1717327 [Coprinellus micaceus]